MPNLISCVSGVIAALLGQGLTPNDAARLAGFLHGMAGVGSGRSSGLLASEIADNILASSQR